MTKNIRYTVDTEDELLKKLNISVPDIKNIKYSINLNIYDASTSTTYIISDVIDQHKDAYTDNTYTIVYDQYHTENIRDYPDSYYVTSIEDLAIALNFIIKHQDIYAVYSTSYCDDDRDTE